MGLKALGNTLCASQEKVVLDPHCVFGGVDHSIWIAFKMFQRSVKNRTKIYVNYFWDCALPSKWVNQISCAENLQLTARYQSPPHLGGMCFPDFLQLKSNINNRECGEWTFAVYIN